MDSSNEDSAIRFGIKAARMIANEIENCEGAPADVKALNKWFKTKAGSKQALVDAATANSMTNSQEIQESVMAVWETFFKFN